MVTVLRMRGCGMSRPKRGIDVTPWRLREHQEGHNECSNERKQRDAVEPRLSGRCFPKSIVALSICAGCLQDWAHIYQSWSREGPPGTQPSLGMDGGLRVAGRGRAIFFSGPAASKLPRLHQISHSCSCKQSQLNSSYSVGHTLTLQRR